MTQQVMQFFGVTTGDSLSLKCFPKWARVFGVQDATLEGVDLPLDASVARYREAVERLKRDATIRGALVTSHKLNVVRAAGDLIDRYTPEARLCGEVSALYKRGGVLWGHACDPANCGRTMEQFLGKDYWERHPEAAILSLGAGGATVAMLVHLLIQARSRPGKIYLIDIREENLDHCNVVLEKLCCAGIRVELVCHSDAMANDRLVTALPPHSLVINATGMGKDLPGSPLTDAVVFPRKGVVWELNYRGQRLFLEQAQKQVVERDLTVVDGWHYFLHGWSSVMGCVFDVPVTQEMFAAFSVASESTWVKGFPATCSGRKPLARTGL